MSLRPSFRLSVRPSVGHGSFMAEKRISKAGFEKNLEQPEHKTVPLGRRFGGRIMWANHRKASNFRTFFDLLPGPCQSMVEVVGRTIPESVTSSTSLANRLLVVGVSVRKPEEKTGRGDTMIRENTVKMILSKEYTWRLVRMTNNTLTHTHTHTHTHARART